MLVDVHRGSSGIALPRLTMALDEDGWSPPHPSHFTPKKETWYPMHKGWAGRV